MESCKQVMSWSLFSEEDQSMTASKEEESSSCTLVHNLISNCNNMMMQEEECSMCGDVGLPQYLFKCLTCSHRYQHIYCSKFYPYRMEATICNWCMPMEQLFVNNIAEIDDNKDNTKFNNSNIYPCRNTKSVSEAINPNSLLDPQAQKLEKHTSKAFEYLLQVAALHADQGHQLENSGRPIDEDNCIAGKFSGKKSVGPDQITGICSFYEVGHGRINAKDHHNQEPDASLMINQIIFGGCSDDHNRSFYPRKGDKIDYVRGASATSTQLRHNHSQLQPAYMGHDQIVKNLMKQDVGHSQLMKKLNSQDLRHDQIMPKLNNQDLDHNQTIKNLNYQGQVHDLQEHASPVKDHQIGCSDDQSLKWPDAGALSKRARLHKQLQAATGGDYRNNAADQQKLHSQAANYNVSSDDSDDQHVGKGSYSWQGSVDSPGPAKRPRHRQSGAQIDVFNSAARQPREIAGNNDLLNTAAANDQQRVISMKQSSPTQHAWNRSAGKRDHLMNSPSRAINRRYKLLADVLC